MEIKDAMVLSRFGTRLGDGIMAVQALLVARNSGAMSGRIKLLDTCRGSFVIRSLLESANHIQFECLSTLDLQPQSRIIDLRGFLSMDAYKELPQIDFLLGQFGVTSSDVEPEAKRNTWISTSLNLDSYKDDSRHYVIFAGESSNPTRCLPHEYRAEILRALLAVHDGDILTLGSPCIAHRRIVQIPDAPDLDALIHLVLNARYVVSTDTGLIHLADGLSVKTLAFFNVQHPIKRVRDYPLCSTFYAPAPLDLLGKLRGTFTTEDMQRIRAAWFEIGAIEAAYKTVNEFATLDLKRINYEVRSRQ